MSWLREIARHLADTEKRTSTRGITPQMARKENMPREQAEEIEAKEQSADSVGETVLRAVEGLNPVNLAARELPFQAELIARAISEGEMPSPQEITAMRQAHQEREVPLLDSVNLPRQTLQSAAAGEASEDTTEDTLAMLSSQADGYAMGLPRLASRYLGSGEFDDALSEWEQENPNMAKSAEAPVAAMDAVTGVGGLAKGAAKKSARSAAKRAASQEADRARNRLQQIAAERAKLLKNRENAERMLQGSVDALESRLGREVASNTAETAVDASKTIPGGGRRGAAPVSETADTALSPRHARRDVAQLAEHQKTLREGEYYVERQLKDLKKQKKAAKKDLKRANKPLPADAEADGILDLLRRSKPSKGDAVIAGASLASGNPVGLLALGRRAGMEAAESAGRSAKRGMKQVASGDPGYLTSVPVLRTLDRESSGERNEGETPRGSSVESEGLQGMRTEELRQMLEQSEPSGLSETSSEDLKGMIESPAAPEAAPRDISELSTEELRRMLNSQ